jgi:hypothetical protein
MSDSSNFLADAGLTEPANQQITKLEARSHGKISAVFAVLGKSATVGGGSGRCCLSVGHASCNCPDVCLAVIIAGLYFNLWIYQTRTGARFSVLMVGSFLILFGGYMLWINFLSPNREKI